MIRAAVLHVATTPLDLWRRFEISSASITIIIIAYETVGRRCRRSTAPAAAFLI